MKIFLDFDDVVFNTKEFLIKLQSIFQDFGIPEELFHTTYQAVKSEYPGKDFCYSFLAHVEKIKQHATFDSEGLCSKLDTFLQDTKDFVFSDVRDFLQFLETTHCTVNILSFGDSDYQYRKIVGAGLTGLVERVIVTQQSKQQTLIEEQLDPHQETWFFDDRVHFLEGVKKDLPFIKTVLVRRKEGRFTEEANEFCDYTITSLAEAKSLL